jgi:thiamine biosynthesis lipoprotein
METVTLSAHLMATRFELVLCGEDAVRLRAGGEEALAEIERLDEQLNFYSPSSEITWINSHAAKGPVKVDPRLFRALQACAQLSLATDQSFDITIGPLMRAWRLHSIEGRRPAASELEASLAVVGMRNIELDEEAFTVRFKRSGVEIDLGGYGKGYAIERAISILRDYGIESALLHGGTSSVYGIGSPPDQNSWRIRLSEPLGSDDQPSIIDLSDSALSVSAIHGRSFTIEGRVYGHVLDPRTGQPVSRALASAVRGPSASACEALSTALLVFGPSWTETMSERFPGYQAIIAPPPLTHI